MSCLVLGSSWRDFRVLSIWSAVPLRFHSKRRGGGVTPDSSRKGETTVRSTRGPPLYHRQHPSWYLLPIDILGRHRNPAAHRRRFVSSGILPGAVRFYRRRSHRQTPFSLSWSSPNRRPSLFCRRPLQSLPLVTERVLVDSLPRFGVPRSGRGYLPGTAPDDVTGTRSRARFLERRGTLTTRFAERRKSRRLT